MPKCVGFRCLDYRASSSMMRLTAKTFAGDLGGPTQREAVAVAIVNSLTLLASSRPFPRHSPRGHL